MRDFSQRHGKRVLCLCWTELPNVSHKPSGLGCSRERLCGFLPCSSRPVVDVVTEMSFSPNEIPVHEVECSFSASQEQKKGVTLTVCFQMQALTTQFQGHCHPPVPRRAPSIGRTPHRSTASLCAQVACLPTSATPCSWMAIGRADEVCSREGATSSVGTHLSPQLNPAWTSGFTSR